MVQEGEGVEAEREWYMSMGARKVREEDERRKGGGGQGAVLDPSI